MIVAGGLSVAACGAMTPEQQDELEASFACVERADAVFPAFAQMSDTANESSDFHVDGSGGFVLEFKVSAKDRPLPERFECRGNLTDRTIEMVELNGVNKHPNPSEIWKY